MKAPEHQPLVQVKLYGHLRTRFQKCYRLVVKSPAEAIRALCFVVPGFQQYLRDHSEPGYRVVVGKTPIADEKDLGFKFGLTAIKIVPAVAGAAGGGKVLAGIALIGLSFTPLVAGLPALGSFTASGLAFNTGLSLALAGVAQMLAGNPKSPGPQERPDNQPSYAFNGPVNVTAQGHPVPLVYGRMRVGSVVVSSGLSVSQLPATT